MAKYKAPGIAVHQTIQQDVVSTVPDQNVALVGPVSALKLYSSAATATSDSYVGLYETGKESAYVWNRGIGDTDVDFGFTNVYLRNALLSYGKNDVTVKAGKYNQVTVTGTANFADPTRAIKAGDIIRLTVDGQTITSIIHTAVNITLDNEVVDGPFEDDAGNVVAGITVDGSYKGNNDVTYILDIVKGGDLNDPDAPPIVRARTVSGEDTTEEIELDQADGYAYKLGTRGLTFKLDSGTLPTLTQGDSYYFTTTAVQEGDTRQLTLRQNLPLQAADLVVSDAEFFVSRSLSLDSSFYTQTNEALKLADSISTVDWEFGDDILLPVVQADIYADVRIWNIPTTANSFQICETYADLEEQLPGPLHPANILKYGIYKALQNSGEKSVLYSVVKDPTSVESWQEAFNRIGKTRDAYAIVPLTDDEDVLKAAKVFVDEESTDEINRRKELWVHRSLNAAVQLVSFTDDKPALITIIDNPDTTIDTSINMALSSTHDFVLADVRPGDELRTNYFIDIKGHEQYDAYRIQQVVNGQTLVLQDCPAFEIKVPQKFEIWRKTTSANFLENIGKVNNWNDRRVIAVYPFELSCDGQIVDGYYGAAMVAALTCSFDPNQSSSQKTLTGIDDIIGYDTLYEKNLDELAVQGITILAKDDDGVVFVRHTITTGDFDTLHEREEMTTRNFDSISNYYTAALNALRGNITSTLEGVTAVFNTLQVTGDQLMLRYSGSGKSGQIVDYVITGVSIDPVFKDVINAYVDLELPSMANRIELYLQAVSLNSAAGVVLSSSSTTAQA